MSEASKAARAAMKSKIKRITATDPKAKVDASEYTPPDALDADIKTGMRPVSQRQFKKGGKVSGEAHKSHAGRKPRKSGGRALTADSLINRNAKEANEEREGKKHIGGMKKGGRTHNDGGGRNPRGDENEMTAAQEAAAAAAAKAAAAARAGRERTEAEREDPRNQKRGGRTKKMDGGPMDPRTGIVPKDVLTFGPGGPKSPVIGLKKGGAAKWEGSAKDEAQDKKLAKKHGMSMKSWESSKMDKKHDEQHSMKGLKKGGRADKSAGGNLSEDGDIQGTRPTGGRKARKAGGRAKGKTQIHINIGGMKPPMEQRPPMAGAPVGGPPPMGGMPPMGPPAGAPPVGGPPVGGAPAGLPPALAQLIQGRKAGGRTYPKMRYGAGSGMGRLEKIEEYGEAQKKG